MNSVLIARVVPGCGIERDPMQLKAMTENG